MNAVERGRESRQRSKKERNSLNRMKDHGKH